MRENNIDDFSTQVKEVIDSHGFSELSKKDQGVLIKQLTDNADNNSGKFGKFFGTNKENSIIYITLIICITLMMIGMLVLLINKKFVSEYWNGVFPIISGALCYMYGKESNKR